MENINNNETTDNLVTRNNPIPPAEPILKSKPNDFFKILFFVTFLFLLGTIIVIFFLIKNPKQSIITENNNQTEKSTIPTVIEKNKKYEAISVQDDRNTISSLILKDDQGNKTVIDESKYWKLNDEADAITAKPSYTDFVFSSDNNFLYYFHNSGWEASSSFLYDIEKKEKIDLEFTVYLSSSDKAGFTSDSKYFYACGRGGMMSGGAVVKDLLQQNKDLFYKPEGSFKCEYDKAIGDIKFYEFGSLATASEKIISEYNFSQRLGELSKIK